MSDKLEPHDSAYTYSSQKKRHWYEVGVKIAQSERDTSKRNYILAFLIALTVLGGVFGFGYLVSYTIVAPPTNVLGYCPPPAFVDQASNNCVVTVFHTDTNGKVSSSLQPAGYIIGNATCNAYQCQGG